MSDERKTKKELVAELKALRERVAELEKAESSYVQAEELVRIFRASTPIGLFVIQDGDFRFVNENFRNITGSSPAELIGTEPRHLVLPDDAAGSLDLLAWLCDEVGPCALSLLRQYRPMFRIAGDPRLDRPITGAEYRDVVEAARWMGFDPIFVQDAGCEELGVPDWDSEGVFDWERG